jgi:hypothetical protein
MLAASCSLLCSALSVFAGGQRSDPLTRLLMFFALAAFAAVRCVAEVSL